MIDNICRGELYIADLNPFEGCEQGGIRPVLIIQNDKGNKFSTTTIVAPITSNIYTKKRIPTHFTIDYALDRKSVVLFEQIRVIDKNRILRYIGKLNSKDLKNIDNKILETISKNLTETETYIMLKEAKHSTKWVYEIIQKIAKEKKLNTENWQINNK